MPSVGLLRDIHRSLRNRISQLALAFGEVERVALL